MIAYMCSVQNRTCVKRADQWLLRAELKGGGDCKKTTPTHQKETFEHLGSSNMQTLRWIRYMFAVFSLLLLLFKSYAFIMSTVGICNAFHE